MAQTYTLDEAANRLGMSAEEFKRRLKDEWKSIRSFRDGATLRFRSADIDELAKQLWGHLPQRTREQVLQTFSEDFLPKYEREIEEYYRRLSEEQPPPQQQ